MKKEPILVWDYGTEVWVVCADDHTICPARIVDIHIDESSRKDKHFHPVYTLVWSNLLWSGPDNTFVYDSSFIFERTPEGTRAAAKRLHDLIMDDIHENDEQLLRYRDRNSVLCKLLRGTSDAACFDGITSAERKKINKLLQKEEE